MGKHKKIVSSKTTHGTGGTPLRHALIDYIGYTVDNIFFLIKDVSYVKVKRVRCNYICKKTRRRCKTLLCSDSIKTETGRCCVHRNAEVRKDCRILDSVWKCTVKKGKKICGRPSHHREVIAGHVIYRCNKHLDEHLGFKK